MFYWGRFIVLLFFLAGCAGAEQKSELLSLLGVDEKIVDTEENTENTYDAITLLKRGEAFYVKEDYIEAVAEFDRFLLLHPFHRMAAFAQFKMAMSYFQQINTIDRDPGPMEKAMSAFAKVVSQYPQSLYVEEAKEKISNLKRREAEYEFLVGHFYYRTEAYSAAIARFEKILARETEDRLLEKTLYFLGLSYFEKGDSSRASNTFEQLLEKYPHSSFEEKIKQIQSNLQSISKIS